MSVWENHHALFENRSLRAQLGMSEKVVSTEISIQEAFNEFDLIKGSDPSGIKERAFNALRREGIKTLNDLQGFSIYNLLSLTSVIYRGFQKRTFHYGAFFHYFLGINPITRPAPICSI